MRRKDKTIWQQDGMVGNVLGGIQVGSPGTELEFAL